MELVSKPWIGRDSPPAPLVFIPRQGVVAIEGGKRGPREAEHRSQHSRCLDPQEHGQRTSIYPSFQATAVLLASLYAEFRWQQLRNSLDFKQFNVRWPCLETPVARATREMPPRPMEAASAAAASRRVRSLRKGAT